MAASNNVLTSATAVSFKALCSFAFATNQGDCSGLVKEVARFVGVYLPDVQANGLIDFMSSYWDQVSDDDAQGFAEQARFVVAGLKASPNGHVLIVLPGGEVRSGGYQYTDQAGTVRTAAFHGSYPRSCSTALGGWPGAISNGDKSVFDAWGNVQKYARVQYWLAPLPGTEACKKPAAAGLIAAP